MPESFTRLKSSEGTTKPTTSIQESVNSSQDKCSSISQDTAKGCQEVWSLPQLVTKAEIIAALQFASQNVPYSCADALQECYKQVSRLCNCKTCCSGTKEDVIYGGLWFRVILSAKDCQGYN